MGGQLLSSKIVVVEEEPRVRGIPSSPTAVVGAIGISGLPEADDMDLATRTAALLTE